jgi:glycosyltransferase involved in cell wall biosynthesis
MKVVNTSKNTLYAEDIDFYVPFTDEMNEIDLSPDILKKSKSIRGYVLNGMLDIKSHDETEQIEQSLVYLKRKKVTEFAEKLQAQQTEEPIIEVVHSLPTAPDLVKTDDQIEVKIHGLFYDDSGYAKVNRNLAIKLHQAGFKVHINAKNSKNRLNESELKKFMQLSKGKPSKNHILIDSIVPSFAEMSTGKYRILYTTIESYTVPKQFLQCCDMYQEIWTTSPWSAKILGQYIKDKPIYVIPAGVDETLYTPEGPSFQLRPKVKEFVFISVFGWSYRKGYDVLLKAYFYEFSADDDVTLLIMSKYQGGTSRHHKNKIKEDIEKIMGNFPNKDLPHVLRHSHIIAEQDMPKMYRACNCFVILSRGEGSNLCAVEASLCGLPLIMTNCSGQQMYLRPGNAYLIEPDELVEVQRGQMHLHYWDGQQFPALTSQKVHENAKQAMRHVYHNYQEAQQKNRNLQELIHSNFTWNHTANAASQRLTAIYKELNK